MCVESKLQRGLAENSEFALVLDGKNGKWTASVTRRCPLNRRASELSTARAGHGYSISSTDVAVSSRTMKMTRCQRRAFDASLRTRKPLQARCRRQSRRNRRYPREMRKRPRVSDEVDVDLTLAVWDCEDRPWWWLLSCCSPKQNRTEF